LSQNICVFAMKNINRLPFLLKSKCVFFEAEKICTTKTCTVYGEENRAEYRSVQVFQIPRSHLKILGAQWMNTKQVQNPAPTNTSQRHTKLCRPDGVLTEICAPLVSQSHVSIHFVYAASI